MSARLFRSATGLALSVALAAAFSACVKQYQPPKEGEDAALLKLKLGYGDVKARSLLSPGHFNESVKVALYLHEGDERYIAYSQTYDAAFATVEPVALEIHGARIRPGNAAAFEVRLSVFWQTQDWEWVTRQYRIPVSRQVTTREYNPATKSYTTRTTTVTDFVIETRQERELVTRDHEQGCTAAVAFAPVKDGVYLLDYTNPEIAADCAVLAYRQQAKEDGSFQLEPVVTGSIQ
jgi:hypothetical protein